MTIKGSLLVSVPIVKPFSAENFQSPTKIGPQNGGFSRNWGSKYYFLFSKPPKGTSLRGTASFDVFCGKISFEASAVASLKNQKKQNNSRTWRVIFHPDGEKKPLVGSAQKFCTGGDIQDVITGANLGDDRLSHFSVARGQILGFSIGFRSRPYNTLALPCECVIKAPCHTLQIMPLITQSMSTAKQKNEYHKNTTCRL